MKKVHLVFTAALFAFSCNNAPVNAAKQKINSPGDPGIVAQPKDHLPVYTAAMLDSKRDHVCGMPVSAGISDTAHFKGKAYGFCSKECKDEFVKHPVAYLPAK